MFCIDPWILKLFVIFKLFWHLRLSRFKSVGEEVLLLEWALCLSSKYHHHI